MKTTKTTIKLIRSIAKSLTCQLGQFGLLLHKKCLKPGVLRVWNNTIWVVITPPNRHIASPLAMKEEESNQKPDELYIHKKWSLKNEGIMPNFKQESPKSYPKTISRRVCAMQIQVSKQCQLLENQLETLHKNLSVNLISFQK